LEARGVISTFMSLPSSSFLGFRMARVCLLIEDEVNLRVIES
jgi:hypothetical protein